MNIILVMLLNIQEYIIDNIKNMQNFQNNNIYVITEKRFENFFKDINIKLIFIEDHIPNFISIKNACQNTIRNGFWEMTSYRFYALYMIMEIYNITNVIHLENDVVIYKNLDTFSLHSYDKIIITMDAHNRCIPGIMYIPNYLLLKECYNNFNHRLNDMQNWAKCFHEKKFIDTFPIIDKHNDFIFLSANFSHYKCIFDAAPIGQFLGGIDPRNDPKNTVGFVNETCEINYSIYQFIWKKDSNNNNIPYIVINNETIPIINLHIHSKNLKNFI